MDIRVLLVALLAITLVWLLILRGKPLSTIEKAALYITAAVFVYMDSVLLQDHRVAGPLIWATILLMALGTILRLRLQSDRRFELTPLDLIVLFVALVLPSLSDSLRLPDGGVTGIAKLVILFYALEALLSRSETRVVWVRLSAATLLAGLILRPML